MNEMIEVSYCPYPGCGKPVKPAPPGHETACGDLHHLLVMCRRFCEKNRNVLPELEQVLGPYYGVNDLYLGVKCAYRDCTLRPSPQFKCWCSENHYCQWLQSFYQLLNSEQQVCKAERCPNHVFVEGVTLRVHDFCCWGHAQRHSMFAGLQRSNESTSSVTTESMAQQSSEEPIFVAFKSYVLHGTVPRNMKVLEHFFKEHPWNILSREEKSCTLIAKRTFKEKKPEKRELITKDGYHWKQKGPPTLGEPEKRYFIYERLKGIKRKITPHDSNDESFSMTELSFGDSRFKEYCIVTLQRTQKRNPKIRIKEEPDWLNEILNLERYDDM